MAVYLDHNATTPVDRRVVEAMLPYLQEHYGNPSSLYRRGRFARQAIEMAREQVARLVNANAAQVIFTGGGSEANNLAIRGAVPGLRRLAVSAVEHTSVLETARVVAQQGAGLRLIEVDSSGRVTEAVMAQALSSSPQLVSVMMANNETGVIQDIQPLAAQVMAQGGLFHTDAVQAAGKVALDFKRLGVQLMTLSAHKLYGPKGVGALICDSHVELTPQIVGGGQEHGYRSGTENVAAIVGFGKAAELALEELTARQAHLNSLRQSLEQRLVQLGGVVIFAQEAQRLPNTVFLAIPGIDGETLLMELDKLGIEVSSGSACDSQKSGPSHVLVAMGIEESIARSAVRISFGRDNSEADVTTLVTALKQQVEVLRSTTMLAWI
jgi:cysteine desulfurase